MTAKSSITGRFVTAVEAILHPETTYTVKPPRQESGKVPCPTCKGRGYVDPEPPENATTTPYPED